MLTTYSLRGVTKCRRSPNDVDSVNKSGKEMLWDDKSPLRTRPQYHYEEDDIIPSEYLHVVGHTPMKEIMQQKIF